MHFDGLEDEDPNSHIVDFFRDLWHIQNQWGSLTMLIDFPCFHSHWEEGVNLTLERVDYHLGTYGKKFLMKYFPPIKISRMGNEISSYCQLELERL